MEGGSIVSGRSKVLRENAGRWLGEFLVIVVGILVALAVDGWVQDREDRQAEAKYLERLIEDLEWDLAQMDEVLESKLHFDRAITGVLRLLGDPHAETKGRAFTLPDGTEPLAAPVPPPDLPEDSVVEAFSQAFGGMREFDHRRGTYDELISTGATRVLRDSDLRSAIASYYSAVDANLELHFLTLREPLRELGLYIRDQGLAVSDLSEIADPLARLRAMSDLPVHLRVRRENAMTAAFLVLLVRPQAVELKARLEAELEALR